MDASTILYIILGIGALFLQGYMEKKKREQARQRHSEESHDDAYFHEEDGREPSINDIFPSLPNLFASSSEQNLPVEEAEKEERVTPAKRVEYTMIDIPVTEETSGEEIAGEGISSFKHINNTAQENPEEKTDEQPIFIDLRNLVLYSEIMAPKFRE